MFISVMKCIWQAKAGLRSRDQSIIAEDEPDRAESANPVESEPNTNPSDVHAAPTVCLPPEQGWPKTEYLELFSKAYLQMGL